MNNTKFFFIALFALFATGAHADIASQKYADTIANTLTSQLNAKADDNAVVHLTGDETIGGNKIFSNVISTTADVPTASDNNTVATTKWTNARISSTRDTIRIGDETSTSYANIWLE